MRKENLLGTGIEQDIAHVESGKLHNHIEFVLQLVLIFGLSELRLVNGQASEVRLQTTVINFRLGRCSAPSKCEYSSLAKISW
jgi:hypothetical protein